MENRDERGRFTEGNRAAAGRKIDRLKAEMLAAVSADDIHAVVDALIAKAREGDVKAAGLLLDRIFGRPHQNKEPQPIELDDGGAGEIEFDDGGETPENKIKWEWGEFERKQKEQYEKAVNARAEQLVAEREKQGA